MIHRLSEFLTSGFWQHLVDAVLRRVSGENGIALALLWGTVLLAAVVTYVRARRQQRATEGFLRHVLPAGLLRHPSARADFLFWLSRRIFMPLLVLPVAISTVVAGQFAYSVLKFLLGPPSHPPHQAGPLTLVAFTITMFLAYDLAYYLYHRAQHRVPLLWELHKVHHSAEVMVGVTKDRVHPLDEIMNRWWNGVIPGLCYGIWLFFVLDPVEVTVFGLNVYMLSNTVLMMDFVRHTHLKLSYGRWLNALFLCPHWHQLHHSVAQRHWDKNFGLALSVWDRWFGTLAVPEPDEDFEFGLMHNEHAEYQSLYRLHVVPLKKMARLLRQRRGVPSATREPPDHAKEAV